VACKLALAGKPTQPALVAFNGIILFYTSSLNISRATFQKIPGVSNIPIKLFFINEQDVFLGTIQSYTET
jgi:hypothetical protein